jgi:hypothetical protein
MARNSPRSVRGIFVEAQFFVTAAALRNGEFHVVKAAIVSSGVIGYRFADDSDVRKALFGDHTAESVRDHFIGSVVDAACCSAWSAAFERLHWTAVSVTAPTIA